jgi:hypothetical protein
VPSPYPLHLSCLCLLHSTQWSAARFRFWAQRPRWILFLRLEDKRGCDVVRFASWRRRPRRWASSVRSPPRPTCSVVPSRTTMDSRSRCLDCHTERFVHCDDEGIFQNPSLIFSSSRSISSRSIAVPPLHVGRGGERTEEAQRRGREWHCRQAQQPRTGRVGRKTRSGCDRRWAPRNGLGLRMKGGS